MKSLIGLLVLGFGLPAMACFDRDFKWVSNPQEQLAVYDQYSGFAKCVDKMEGLGVNLKKVSLAIKSRPNNDLGRVAKWFRIQGQDKTGQTWFIMIEQRIGRQGGGFYCEEPSDRITRGC